MAVIINEFEVVAEPAARQADAPQPAAEQSSQAPSETLSPFSLEMIIRQRLQRQARVRAD